MPFYGDKRIGLQISGAPFAESTELALAQTCKRGNSMAHAVSVGETGITLLRRPTYCISYRANTPASIAGPFGTATSRKNSSIFPAGVNAINMCAGVSPTPEKACGIPRGPRSIPPHAMSPAVAHLKQHLALHHVEPLFLMKMEVPRRTALHQLLVSIMSKPPLVSRGTTLNKIVLYPSECRLPKPILPRFHRMYPAG